MAIEAVQLYLCQDVLGIAASAAQAANPEEWPTVASVPWYAYRSLGEMLVLGSCSSSILATKIIFKIGEGKEEARGSITLSPVDYDSAGYRGTIGYDSNQTGAETSVMDVQFNLPLQPGINTYQRMESLVLRVRSLIDENWRKERRANPVIPNLGDYSITNFVRCTWERHPVAMRADEAWERYVLCYTRAVPKVL